MTDPNDDAIDALLCQQFDGAVRDDGFSERVRQRLPPRRQRIAWPLWLGGMGGVAASWLSLLATPVLRVSWHDWIGGELSGPAMTVLAAGASMSLLACCWSIAEADDR